MTIQAEIVAKYIMRSARLLRITSVSSLLVNNPLPLSGIDLFSGSFSLIRYVNISLTSFNP